MTVNEILSARITNDLLIKPMNEKEWRDYVCAVTEAGGIPAMYGIEPTAEFLKNFQVKNPVIEAYSVHGQDKKGQIGYFGLNVETGRIECYIYPDERKKGYGTQAMKTFVEMCLDGSITGEKMKKITATVYGENEAADKLLAKTGFRKQEGTTPAEYILCK